jgi:Fe-S oxidoreductase
MPDGSAKVVGFAEGSRGCKHWCRHCPVVPVYQGKFRIVQVPVVLADIRSQVAMGAEHISFGDPDFLNGPTHALKLARALHAEFPDLSFDATIKVQHLIEHAMLLPELKRCGCLYVTSAVEAVDDRILEYLDKNHSAEDFGRAVALLRQAGIAFAPTSSPSRRGPRSRATSTCCTGSSSWSWSKACRRSSFAFAFWFRRDRTC